MMLVKLKNIFDQTEHQNTFLCDETRRFWKNLHKRHFSNKNKEVKTPKTY